MDAELKDLLTRMVTILEKIEKCLGNTEQDVNLIKHELEDMSAND